MEKTSPVRFDPCLFREWKPVFTIQPSTGLYSAINSTIPEMVPFCGYSHRFRAQQGYSRFAFGIKIEMGI